MGKLKKNKMLTRNILKFQKNPTLTNFQNKINNFPNKFFTTKATAPSSHYQKQSTSNKEKIALLLTMENKPGVLGKFANIFAANSVNLSYISSRPSTFITEEKRTVDFLVD